MKVLRNNLIAALFWLGVWSLLSQLADNDLLLPGPGVVLSRLAQLALTGEFWVITGTSLLRILLGTVLAVVLGTLLAAICCRIPLLDILSRPLVTIIKSTPVASFIILLILWVGRDALPAVIVVLMVLPVVWSNVCAGIRNTDPQLLRTARVFRCTCSRAAW